MVAAHDSKSCVVRHEGSSPSPGTKYTEGMRSILSVYFVGGEKRGATATSELLAESPGTIGGKHTNMLEFLLEQHGR